MKKTLSKNNPYYISEYRRKELEYFVKQYPEWQEALHNIKGDISSSVIKVSNNTQYRNSTEELLALRDYYQRKIDIVDNALDRLDVCEEINGDIFKNVVYGITYDCMNARKRVPCGRRQFYSYIRKFYILLYERHKT